MRKKLLVKSLPVVAILFLVGCGKEKEKSTNTNPLVPDSLTFTKPSPGQKLTKEQIRETTAALKPNNKFIIPPSELIFASNKLTAQQIQQKEESIKNRDPHGYALLKDIQANCEVSRPTTNINASFPTTGNLAIENLRTGDHLHIDSNAELFGSNCPVKYESGISFKANANEVDPSNKKLNLSSSGSLKTQALMVSPKYQSILNSRGVIVDSNMSGLAIKQDTHSKMLFTFNLSGTYFSLKSDIPYSAKVQVLASDKSAGINTYTEMIVEMNLVMPAFTIDIDVYIKSGKDDQKPIEEYFVNGHQMSRQEFDALFGKENPAISSANTIVKTYKF